MELDDDLFFAELSEQIALLIMDEEEEFPLKPIPAITQGFQYQHVPQVIIPQPQIYYEYAYKRESKGTGVFIPQFTAPRKKNKSNRNSNSNSNSNSNNSNSQKKQEKNRGASSISGISGQREKAALSSH